MQSRHVVTNFCLFVFSCSFSQQRTDAKADVSLKGSNVYVAWQNSLLLQDVYFLTPANIFIVYISFRGAANESANIVRNLRFNNLRQTLLLTNVLSRFLLQL